MVMANRSTSKETLTRGNGVRGMQLAKGRFSMLPEITMKEISRIFTSMEKVLKNLKMEIFMKENT